MGTSRQRGLGSIGAMILVVAVVHGVSIPRAGAQACGGPSVHCHVTDGTFTTCGDSTQEWSDVTPQFFPESNSYLYADQADLDPGLATPTGPLDTFMLMYDECDLTTPFGPDDFFTVSFTTVEVEDEGEVLVHYVDHIFADGTLLFFENGQVVGARGPEVEGQRGKVGFGTSPTCPFDHAVIEFEIKLSDTGISLDGGYSPDPAFWGSSPPEPPPPPPPPRRVVVVLLTGFSGSSGNNIGMEEIRQQLQAQSGDNVEIIAQRFGHSQQGSAVEFIQNNIRDGAEVVLVGHSLGGDSTIEVAERLQNLPTPVNVDRLVQIDSVGVGDERLPTNVGSGVNIFQNSTGFFEPQGATNVNGSTNVNAEVHYTEGTNITHTNIDNNTNVQNDVVNYVINGTVPTGPGVTPHHSPTRSVTIPDPITIDGLPGLSGLGDAWDSGVVNLAAPVTLTEANGVFVNVHFADSALQMLDSSGATIETLNVEVFADVLVPDSGTGDTLQVEFQFDGASREGTSNQAFGTVTADPSGTFSVPIDLTDEETLFRGFTVEILEDDLGSASITGIRVTLTASAIGQAPPPPPTTGTKIGVVVDQNRRAIVFDSETNATRGSVLLPLSGTYGDCAIRGDGLRAYVTNFVSSVSVLDIGVSPPGLAPDSPNPIPISNSGEDVSISADQRFAVVCDGSGFQPVSVIDLQTGVQVSTLSVGSDCNSVDVCSDGSVLVTSASGLVRRLTLSAAGTLTNTGESLSVGDPNNVACAPDGRSGIVVTRGSRVVRSFLIPGLVPISQRVLSGNFGISGLVNAAGDRVYVRSNGSWVDSFSYDLASGTIGAAPLFHFTISSTSTFFGMDQMALSGDDSRLYVAQPGAVRVYDAHTGGLLASITHPDIVSPTGVCLGPGQVEFSDRDGDGVADAIDNCPLTANTDQADGDLNGIGSACQGEGATFTTAAFLQATPGGCTTAEPTSLLVADEPSLEEKIARIVEFRVDAGLTDDPEALAASLVQSVVDAGLVDEDVQDDFLDDVIVLVNQPPACDASDAYVEECQGAATTLLVDGSGSTDPDGDQLTYQWQTDCPGGLFDEGGSAVSALTVDSSAQAVACNVTLTVSDGLASATCGATVTVADRTPPELVVTVTPETLWPPNHQMVAISPSFQVTDVCDPDPTVVVLDGASSEADNAPGGGDGNTVNDVQITNATSISLRSERQGSGPGRLYQVVFAATDSTGNVSLDSTVEVIVPHSMGGGGGAAGANDSGAVGPATAFGDPLLGLTGGELARFAVGADDFAEEEDVAEGLGPVFNDVSCVSCHAGPAAGGGSDLVETRFGAVSGGLFDPLPSLGGSLIQVAGIGAVDNCVFTGEVVPPEATIQAGRRTTPLFGLGLVDAVDEGDLLDVAELQAESFPFQAGTPNIVHDIANDRDAVGRFGWKAQAPTLHQFTGDAYVNEMGVTNPDFPDEACPQGDCALLQCNPAPGLNDDGTGVAALSDFETFLAPPPRLPRDESATRGNATFKAAGCNRCHWSTLTTGDHASGALDQVTFHPYSDFLLHDMGQLGDGIAQGEATGNLMRTAPLWGVRMVDRFLHDGRAATLEEAIEAHDGQGAAARNKFNALPPSQQADLINFLNTL